MEVKGKSSKKKASPRPDSKLKTAAKRGTAMMAAKETKSAAKAASSGSCKAACNCKDDFKLIDSTETENLKKLSKSPLIMNFVKRKDGCWNHHDWLEFLSDVKKKGFDPVNPDQLGLLLEEKKAQYLASK